MATIVVPRPQLTPPPPLTAPALTLNIASDPVPVPNKHLPICSPGSPPPVTPETPPASPPKSLALPSLLHYPEHFPLLSHSPPVHAIDAETLVAALSHAASQPLPDPKLLFPWLHGLNSQNHVQLAFFVARRKTLRKTPKCFRGIILVHCGGDLSRSRLKGAVSPDEILENGRFIDADPKEGFSVRNFQIQTAKIAMMSDIIVYGNETTRKQTLRLAQEISSAQIALRSSTDLSQKDAFRFNTFIVTSPFSEFEKKHPEIIAMNSCGEISPHVMDFFQCERVEMCKMSEASEITRNVWLGPTPEQAVIPREELFKAGKSFDVFVEASDLAQMPEERTMMHLSRALEETDEPQYIEFPSSGSIMPTSWSQMETEAILNTCRWIYKLANPRENVEDVNDDRDADGDCIMTYDDRPIAQHSEQPRKILIHCTDGYTESSLLALAYYMYAECVPVHEAWLQMHCKKQRNFFAYPSDVKLLNSMQSQILESSPRNALKQSISREPVWLSQMDGSLPSRVLPYMYLGNLLHANNPELLRAIGITRVLSVGEPVSWAKEEWEAWGPNNVLLIDRVQDNGVDPLTEEFDRCLEFIERGRLDGAATLVHCRVGVSRSATICIAEVMKSMEMSFPRAYCFVRARRLNVIIQPHLRFAYELLKWEEYQQTQRGLPIQRELEWATIAREIALMNRPYSR